MDWNQVKRTVPVVSSLKAHSMEFQGFISGSHSTRVSSSNVMGTDIGYLEGVNMENGFGGYFQKVKLKRDDGSIFNFQFSIQLLSISLIFQDSCFLLFCAWVVKVGGVLCIASAGLRHWRILLSTPMMLLNVMLKLCDGVTG